MLSVPNSLRTSSFVVILCAAIGVVTGGAAAAHASARIVNGLPTQNFPTTAALLYSQDAGIPISEDNAATWCSGTLIGCQTLLVAAHCVRDDTAPSHYRVYLQHGGIATVSSITVNPDHVASLSGRDVAIVKLTDPVTGIEPTPINTTHDLAAIGSGWAGTIAGFGRTGGGSDYGIKRYGAIVTASCNLAITGGEGNDALVCWNYDATVGPAGTDSNTCDGDSGGPLFMDFSGTTELVGVTSAGISTDCRPVDHSWDASVYYNAAWIVGQLGADSTAGCGSIAAVGDPSVTVHDNRGTLGVDEAGDTFTIYLPRNADLVRFTLNGTDDGRFNPDFFVKQGSGASPSAYDCKADGLSVFGSCGIASPAGGTWSVFVERSGGSGEYQATSTVFGGDPPACGNDMREPGEQCDGVDLGDCMTGPCVACECPPPVCGNGMVEQGEDCDAVSDSACPGLCDAGCACITPVCGDGVIEGGEQCDEGNDALCPGQCLGDCSCFAPCRRGDLYGLFIVADGTRFSYRAYLYDMDSDYALLDPRDSQFSLSITDGSNTVSVAIPAADPGWEKADPIRRKFKWIGDGSADGLRRIKLAYRPAQPFPHWSVRVQGRSVSSAAILDTSVVLDFELSFDGTCSIESW